MKGRVAYSRAVALGFIAAVLSLLWFAVLSPLAAWRAAALRDVVEAEGMFNGLVRARAKLTKEKLELTSATPPDLLWRARQSGEAAALVQASITRIATDDGVVLRSIAPTRARELPMAETIGVRVEAQLSLDQLVRLFSRLEASPNALLVERATLRRLNRAEESGPQPFLDVRFDILAPSLIESGTNP